MANYANIAGIEFIEFSSPRPEELHNLFLEFGLSKIATHKEKNVDYYRQNDIHFLLNKTPNGHADHFQKTHGPSICSMGLRVKDRKESLGIVLERGATKKDGEYTYKGESLEAISGIGESLIYFLDDWNNDDIYKNLGFERLENPIWAEEKGLICIDHLTNNVEKGTMQKWADFYKNIFGFTEIRYFDIRGVKTGLTSFALQSPCGTFCIPINEATDKKSQINEYLEEYKGAGIQHIAFISHDIIKTLEQLKSTNIETLDIDDDYYDEVFQRVPNVSEDRKKLQELQLLVDGDIRGYLLQIFTKNVVGPIFIEIIQRKNHYSFGEGNFGALFRSIEKDQQKRGYLD